MIRLTEDQLSEMGYVEVSDGKFQRIRPASVKKKIPTTRKFKTGTLEIGGKKFRYRSDYERVYAIFLEKLKEDGQIKDWHYEPKRFIFEAIKRGTTSYLPDFKVIEPSGDHYWVETKGHMDAKSATKLKRMAKYFPEEKVVLVEWPQIKEIKLKLGL